MKDIPVVVLCGGSGTRLREQTELTPKPLIPIGPYPMVVHIMKWYAKFGFRRFILALGHKQEKFKEYFAHYHLINSDISISTKYGEMSFAQPTDDWDVTLVDTGLNTLKGGRLKRVEKYIDSDTFMMTYGDGIGNVDLRALLDSYMSGALGTLVTVTGVRPAPRFGEIIHNDNCVVNFSEKPDSRCLVNGGFFVMGAGVLDYLTPDCDLEVGPLERLAESGKMQVYVHDGYWACMDSLNDVLQLQKIWDEGRAPWKP